jgi:RNA polymerase sigma-70 factor (ECF subfamily)
MGRSFLLTTRSRAGTRHPEPAVHVDVQTLFEETFPPLHRYCLRLTGDPDVAQDVAQEAFVRLVRDRVEGPEPALRSWLFRVAGNLIRDRYRVTENRRRLLEANPFTPGGGPDPEQELERARTVARVRQALDALSERDRTLLLMREEGFNYQEMADAVNVKATSIGTLLARAQQRFVEVYEPEGAGEDAPMREEVT